MLVSAVQPLNIPLASVVVVPKSTVVRLVQPEKVAPLLNLAILPSNLTLVRLVQPLNAEPPIEVIDAGIVMLSKPQFSKVLSFIAVALPKSNDFSPVQPEKKPAP